MDYRESFISYRGVHANRFCISDMADCGYRKSRAAHPRGFRLGPPINWICSIGEANLSRACIKAYGYPKPGARAWLNVDAAGGPLPRFDGIPFPSMPQGNTGSAPLQAQNSGPIRVPPLSQEKVVQYSSIFEESGAQGGVLSGMCLAAPSECFR